MPFVLLDGPRCFVRQEVLGTEAVYEIFDDGAEVLDAEVVRAPGLPAGKRLRLLAAATRRMERFEVDPPIVASRPLTDGARVDRDGVDLPV